MSPFQTFSFLLINLAQAVCIVFQRDIFFALLLPSFKSFKFFIFNIIFMIKLFYLSLFGFIICSFSKFVNEMLSSLFISSDILIKVRKFNSKYCLRCTPFYKIAFSILLRRVCLLLFFDP